MKRFFLLTSLAVGLMVSNLGGSAGCGSETPAAQCGDGVIGGSEVCDGSAMNGETCESQGFSPEGTLVCASDCVSLDTSACVDSGTVSGLVSVTGDQDDTVASFQLLPDSSRNLYVGGIYSSSTTLTVGDKSLAGLGGARHSFAAKVNPDGTVAWLNGFQGNGTSDDQGCFLILDEAENPFFYGIFSGTTLAAPDRTVSNADGSGLSYDGYGGRFKADGSIDWFDPFASADGDQMYFFSDPASGNLYVNGFFNGPMLALGGQTLANGGAGDAYVARLNPEDGSFLWTTHFSSDSFDSLFPSFGPGGNLYVIGSFFGTTLQVDGANARTNAAAGTSDAFVARLDPETGNLSWITGFASNQSDFVNSSEGQALEDASGRLYVRGQFNGPTLTADTKTLTNADGSGTTNDAFVAQIDASDGSVEWLTGVSSAKSDAATIAMDKDGNVYVGGSFRGSTADVGGKSLTNADASGTTDDSFLARLDPSNGSALWLAGFLDGGTQASTPLLATDSSGTVYINSFFSGTTLTADGKTLTNGDPSGTTFDSYVGKFKPDGTLIWLVGYPGGGQDFVNLTTDASGRLPSDRLYFDGEFQGATFTLGGQTFINADAGGTTEDAFVGRLDPADGSVLWVLPVQSDQRDNAFLVPDEAGRLYLGGDFRGSSVTIQGETLTNADASGTTSDAFVARIAP